jgi:hypothetical protein
MAAAPRWQVNPNHDDASDALIVGDYAHLLFVDKFVYVARVHVTECDAAGARGTVIDVFPAGGGELAEGNAVMSLREQEIAFEPRHVFERQVRRAER